MNKRLLNLFLQPSNKTLPLFFIFLISVNAPSTLAQIYRWVDEDGKTHFSDKPVNSAPVEKVEVDTQRNSYGGGDVLERQRELLDNYDEQDAQRQREQRAEAKEKAQQQRLLSACNSAKDQLRRFEGSALYRLDAQGERVYYSEEARAELMAKYRAGVSKNCK